ncbi:glutathione synthase [Piedraia hortae CBS 480.64]|uniref:Glutathione synthetase n=1 Tax=Piedraia hortae CBS 480.64 TaxID=1314780 RepID=A0A6A7BZR8_9PEZI|nr:glutathione synthase [Piedraia hortae CBS 480.64]
MTYPPALTAERKEHLVTEINDWSIAHGLAVRPGTNPTGALATPAPVTLFPSLFPRVCFDEAISVAEAYNKLYAAVACDEEWLGKIIQELIEIDDFIAGLWKIHEQVKAEGYVQPLNLGLFRSDYLVHQSPSGPEIKQVEFNTIASSFGGLSTLVSSLHSHLSKTTYPKDTLPAGSSLPPNDTIPKLAAGLAAAHAAYGSSPHPTCILFITQSDERNVFDQRHLEYALTTSHNIPVFRLPFSEILARTTLTAERALLYTPPSVSEEPYEVTTIYLRAGYSPHEYTSPLAWPSRHHLERSKCIKCPSILSQLAGSKKIQQVLSTSPHLAALLTHEPEREAVLKTFTEIYPLDGSEEGQKAAAIAIDPARAGGYVLKPQREGGGNNIYRSEIPGFLGRLDKGKWAAFVLMRLIEPPEQQNWILREGKTSEGDVICELGVYGTVLWDQKTGEVMRNEQAGFLLRTKGRESDEGGVAAGFGAVDSPCLVET